VLCVSGIISTKNGNSFPRQQQQIGLFMERERERSVLFNDALNWKYYIASALYINETRAWGGVDVIVTEGDRSAGGKTCSIATIFHQNPTHTGLEPNTDLHCESPVTI
jgi:hypothetical protein